MELLFVFWPSMDQLCCSHVHVVMKHIRTLVSKFHQSDKLVVSYCLQHAIQRQSAIMPSYKVQEFMVLPC